MRLLPATALAALIATAAASAASARPFSRCPDTHWCRAIETLQNAVYVYPAHGTFHLHAGRYNVPGLRISFLDRPGLIAIDGARAAVISVFRARTPEAQLYVHLFKRNANGFFEDVATTQMAAVRPMSVSLHGDRVRVNSLDARGRETTTVYHVAGHGLRIAATRHAQ